MRPSFERALLLYQQERYELAEQELRRDLGAHPHDAAAHALLALCLTRREQFQEATREAEAAVGLAPEMPFAHFALAHVLLDRNRFDEAETAIAEAIRLDPLEADYRAVRAGIHLARRRWAEALEAAEQGLALDPEHLGCANLRAKALVQLGRKEEAMQAVEWALARDPENAFTHVNQGWALLHRGEVARAQEHFREALRLDPELDLAREGIVEALKARNPIYRLMLAYFLWMSRLSRKAMWGVILGGYIGYRVLAGVAAKNPALAPLVWVILIPYLLFVLLTWVADPLFNVLLRFDRFGRLALSREQIVASNWIGGCLLAALVFGGAGLLTGNGHLLLGGVVFLLLSVPLSGTFGCEPGWPRRTMAAYTALLAAVGLGGVGLLLASMGLSGGTEDDPMQSLGFVGFGLFLLGTFFSGWIANGLLMVRTRR